MNSRDLKKMVVGALALCAATLIVASSQAATTWASSGVGVTATCTTGTEAAPTLATQGMSLEGLDSFVVVVKSTASAFSAGTLDAYIYDLVSASWSRAPDLDLTVKAGLTQQAFYGFRVTAPRGRIAFIPNGLGQANVVYLNGSRK
jgi:hypothetical protein